MCFLNIACKVRKRCVENPIGLCFGSLLRERKKTKTSEQTDDRRLFGQHQATAAGCFELLLCPAFLRLFRSSDPHLRTARARNCGCKNLPQLSFSLSVEAFV